MKTITASEAKNRFGAVLDSALVEPVMVEESGRNSVVIMAATEYERLIKMEDAYWAARTVQAEAGGFATADEVSQLIDNAGA